MSRSAFDSAMAASLAPAARHQFGRRVRYFPAGGALDPAGRSITAIVGPVREQRFDEGTGAGGGVGGGTVERTRSCTVLLDDVPEPAHDDEVEIPPPPGSAAGAADAERWTVDLIQRLGQGFAELRLIRTSRTSTGRRGYTIRR